MLHKRTSQVGFSVSDALDPAISNADVTYWLNYHGVNQRRNQKYGAINTAVEATTLNSRTFRLFPQDQFLRDNIQQEDVLIVSVGGNDIALRPTPCTILSLGCMPHICMDYSKVFGSIPVSPFVDCIADEFVQMVPMLKLTVVLVRRCMLRMRLFPSFL